MSLKSHFTLLAQYNKWMNDVIYAAAHELTEDELFRNRNAFFDSIFGTLNHIVVADIFWLKRFATHPHGFGSLEYVKTLPTPARLDSTLFSNLNELVHQRELLDNVILTFINELSDAVLVSFLEYKNSKNVAHTKCFGFLLQHFFNHQTHHRGQVSTLFSQLGIDLGTTDLLFKIPDK